MGVNEKHIHLTRFLFYSVNGAVLQCCCDVFLFPSVRCVEKAVLHSQQFSALKILHVGEDISSRGFFFFFSGFFGGGFPPFFFFFGGLGWRIILLGVL